MRYVNLHFLWRRREWSRGSGSPWIWKGHPSTSRHPGHQLLQRPGGRQVETEEVIKLKRLRYLFVTGFFHPISELFFNLPALHNKATGSRSFLWSLFDSSLKDAAVFLRLSSVSSLTLHLSVSKMKQFTDDGVPVLFWRLQRGVSLWTGKDIAVWKHQQGHSLWLAASKGALTLGPVVPYRVEAWMSPLPSTPMAALTLFQSNCTWASWSTERDPYFYNLLITFLNCSLVPVIYKTVADFSTAFYADIVCCCLPQFKVNPPQRVTAMSVLRICARASVAYWSPPLPADKPCRARVQNGAFTLVKQTGL